MQDTIWLKHHGNQPRLLMRTHTSPQQVRAMRTMGAPFYGVFPGRVFRNEATDARHEVTFDQLEGLVVDRSISMAHLLGVLESIVNQFFGREMRWRVRPGYFAFVEPGVELDAACLCDGKDSSCRICGGSGWLEMVGGGLVHPKVIEAGGLDPREWSGFAFGLGISRLAMLRYSIPDIRLLAGNDWRFIKQFSSLV
jgi:phenylalanyl-tRNA synthetase alpha chain